MCVRNRRGILGGHHQARLPSTMSDVSIMQMTDAATNRMRTATRILKKGKAMHLDDFSAPLTLLIDQFASERSSHRRILHPLMQPNVVEKKRDIDSAAAASSSQVSSTTAGVTIDEEKDSPARRRKKKRSQKSQKHHHHHQQQHQLTKAPVVTAKGSYLRQIGKSSTDLQEQGSSSSERRILRLPPLEKSPNGPELRRQHRQQSSSSSSQSGVAVGASSMATVDSWPATVRHRPALYTHLETYIKRELNGEDDDGTFSNRRLQVMRNVFCEFCDSFKVYSPLLFAVKSEYERAIEHEKGVRCQREQALDAREQALDAREQALVAREQAFSGLQGHRISPGTQRQQHGHDAVDSH